jgi:hypothetical protein
MLRERRPGQGECAPACHSKGTREHLTVKDGRRLQVTRGQESQDAVATHGRFVDVDGPQMGVRMEMRNEEGGKSGPATTEEVPGSPAHHADVPELAGQYGTRTPDCRDYGQEKLAVHGAREGVEAAARGSGWEEAAEGKSICSGTMTDTGYPMMGLVDEVRTE